MSSRAGTKVGFSPSKLRLHNLRKLRTFVELCAVITVVTIQTIILYLWKHCQARSTRDVERWDDHEGSWSLRDKIVLSSRVYTWPLVGPSLFQSASKHLICCHLPSHCLPTLPYLKITLANGGLTYSMHLSVMRMCEKGCGSKLRRLLLELRTSTNLRIYRRFEPSSQP